MKREKEMPPEKDCPFLTRPLYGSGFSERTWKDFLRFHAAASKGKGKIKEKITTDSFNTFVEWFFARLQPCHRHKDRCRRPKRSLRCKYTPLHMVSPISSLLVGSKGLD
jgi:hypothetical protein